MQNLSNTTAVSRSYARQVDKAVLAVSSGMGSSGETIRSIIQDVGSAGLQIEYGSGYHRRLDSALRSNVVGAVNQISMQGSDIVSEDLGCDAREITVHSNPAPDHAPVQGRVFMNAEFEKLQTNQPFQDINGKMYEPFPRKIGEWNCMHFATGFITGVSIPKFTDEQLKNIEKKNAAGFDWNGKHYTFYEGTQLMRRIETEVRRQMDAAKAAKYAGDEVLQEQCQNRIDGLTAKYKSLCDSSGLQPKWNRMRVEGFKKYEKQAET